MARQVKVTRLQAELARAKVEADRARDRTPDPLLVRIAAAAAPSDEPDDDEPAHDEAARRPGQ